jgi:hypothetical protein
MRPAERDAQASWRERRDERAEELAEGEDEPPPQDPEPGAGERSGEGSDA